MTTDAVTRYQAAAETSSDTTKATSNSTVSQDMFLQLLVTQLKNQDPLNPTDSSQFMTQLAQITSVEQLVAIRQDVDRLIGTDTSSTSA